MRGLQLSRTCMRSRTARCRATPWHGWGSNQRCCQAAATPAHQAAPQAAPSAGSKTNKQYPRFYAVQLPQSVGMSVELDPEEAKHAVRVLRLQTGDLVELCDGRGGLVQCELAAASKSSAMLVATGEPMYQPWQGPQWVVAAACLTLKGGRTDWLVEKATELGAHSLLPLITARSQTGTNRDKFKALAQKAGQRKRKAAAGDAPSNSSMEWSQDGSSSHSSSSEASRLERLAVAATKQSLRVHGLQVQPAVSLEQLLPQLQAAPVALVAMGGAPPVLQVLQQQWQLAQQDMQQQQQHGGLESRPHIQFSAHPWDCRPCYILIGPEGDFTAEEAEQLSAAGVLPAGLGPHRLRTETAAVAALSAAVLLTDSNRSS